MTDEQDSIAIGQHLRTIRMRQGLSLREVETESDNEFKASALSSYERGDRAITIERLKRLADFYHLPLEHRLPGHNHQQGPNDRVPITLDLNTFRRLAHPRAQALYRFASRLLGQRPGHGGNTITFRETDIHAIAALLETTAQGVPARLNDLAADTPTRLAPNPTKPQAEIAPAASRTTGDKPKSASLTSSSPTR